MPPDLDALFRRYAERYMAGDVAAVAEMYAALGHIAHGGAAAATPSG